MNWWERKAQKTEEEIELDAALQAYEDHFGEQYVFEICGKFATTSETIAEIRKLIETDQKQTLMEYEKGMLY